MTYESLLLRILGGKNEVGDELFQLRDSKPEQQFERLLLVIRKQNKLNPFLVNLESIEPGHAPTPFLKAETHFTRSLILYSRGEFQKGVDELLLSLPLYPADATEQKLRAHYNLISGKINIAEIERGTKSTYSNDEIMGDLGDLIAIARQKESRHVEGLARRQRASQWEFSGELDLAKEELDMAIALLEGRTPTSDLQLALYQRAWLHVLGKDFSKAETSLKRGGFPTESRCEFAYEFLNSILRKHPLDASKLDKLLELASPAW